MTLKDKWNKKELKDNKNLNKSFSKRSKLRQTSKIKKNSSRAMLKSA